MKSTFYVLAILAAPVAAAEPALQACADGSGPRAAVMGYLTAMHENRFSDAFDFVTDTMTDGHARADWSALQASAYRPGKVAIYGVDVRDAKAPGDDPECRTHAVVPNVLSSRDKLNEHGSVEFEIYFVVRDGESWRVDSQETLFDDPAIRRWFPDVKAIESPGPE